MTIILITDLMLLRTRKQEELAFYNEQLKTLLVKRAFVNAEIDLTTRIITLVEQDKIKEVK